ncbi:hypothetical protein PRIC2_012057 [Phytophthora ramorum]
MDDMMTDWSSASPLSAGAWEQLSISTLSRSRVAHFDPLNDITPDHFEAVLAARLRNGHTDITRMHCLGSNSQIMGHIGRAIREVLGGDWVGPLATVVAKAQFYVFSHAGGARRHCPGLQRCYDNSGEQCDREVPGPFAAGVRQQGTRRTPKVAVLKKAFWAARRTADAVGVASWSTLPRECNRTTHEIMKEVRTTQQGISWTAREATPRNSKWTAIIACADTDIRAWLNERTEQQQAAAGSGAV